MVKKSVRPSTRSSKGSPNFDGDGHQVHNEILLSLPLNEFQTVLPKLEFVRLNMHHLLHEAGDSLKSAYFCNHGMISILSVFPDGKSVEVGLVGKEGFVGLPLVAGFQSASNRAIVQVEATAFRVNADALTALLITCPKLERRLQQVSQIMAMETTQIAACNRLHEVEERLARWLLMCAERVGKTSLPLTQELLAQMLGTRRSSVTVSAGILQKAGLIHYSRGKVDILNVAKLEQSACECYEIMRRQQERWRREQEII
jgi:CRP-like cAMP-binding protein